MNNTIPAVFDSGVFRPLKPVELAEGTPAEVIPLSQPVPSFPVAVGQYATWPVGYFEQTAGALAGEQFERPSPGIVPHRDSW